MNYAHFSARQTEICYVFILQMVSLRIYIFMDNTLFYYIILQLYTEVLGGSTWSYFRNSKILPFLPLIMLPGKRIFQIKIKGTNQLTPKDYPSGTNLINNFFKSR